MNSTFRLQLDIFVKKTENICQKKSDSETNAVFK